MTTTSYQRKAERQQPSGDRSPEQWQNIERKTLTLLDILQNLIRRHHHHLFTLSKIGEQRQGVRTKIERRTKRSWILKLRDICWFYLIYGTDLDVNITYAATLPLELLFGRWLKEHRYSVIEKQLSYFRTFDYSRAYILQKSFAALTKVCFICTNYRIFADWGKVLVLPLSHVYCSPTNTIPPRPVHFIDQIRNEGQQMLCTATSSKACITF